MDVLATDYTAGRGNSTDEGGRVAAGETTGGHEEPVCWVRVATATGTPNATIIAGRLESVGIPTRVTQEAAGINVIAVNVGLLGTAYVWVPEEFEEQALQVLSETWDDEEE